MQKIKRIKMKKFTLFLAMCLLLTACTIPASLHEALETSATALEETIATAVENAASTEILNLDGTPSILKNDALYSDDFSDNQSGWEVSHDSLSNFYYQDGEYHIAIMDHLYTYMSIAEQEYTTGIFSVEVRPISGDPATTGGIVMWRYQDNENYYAVSISGNGEFFVSRLIDGNYEQVSLPTANPAIKTDGSFNQVTVVFYASTFDIFINDVFVYSFHDSNLPNGRVGIGAYPGADSEVEVAFDNLAVYAYDPQSDRLPVKPQATSTPTYQAMTWEELVSFLAQDHTNWHEYDLEKYNCLDYAVDLTANAKAQNIQARIVAVDFVGQETGHAFVEFVTSDRGPIFVEPQGDNTYSNVEIGNNLCDDWGQYECMGIIKAIHYFGECNHDHICTSTEP